MDISSLAQEYLKGLKIDNKIQQFPKASKYFIGLIGSYGVGKSTIAKMLSEKLGFLVVSSDDCRRMLDKKKMPYEEIDDNKIIFIIGSKVIKELMKRNLSIILDADLIEPHFREAIKKRVEENGYSFLLINIISDKYITEKRINVRLRNETSDYLKKNMKKHFVERQNIHLMHKLPPVFFTFNTCKDLESQIKNFLRKFTSSSNNKSG